ncbi:MAG: hypothetical protein VKK98_02205 [Cyanobacteriota bacterium]|nr:hypothetical protein [Cyanobacteriota bacterium]
MKRSPLLPELLSVGLSLLALGFGALLIRAKLQDRPSIKDDLVLTVDEQRALPDDVMPVVLLQRPWNDENSLPFLMLKLVLSRSGEKYALGYGETVMDTKDSLQHIAASKGLSAGNPTGLSVGLFGAIDVFKPDVLRLPTPVDGGLLGLRFSCINVRHGDRFKAVKSVSELKSYLAVQARGFSDVRVLVGSGLPTYETAGRSYLNLLDQGRVDYLPRGLANLEEECGPRAAQLGYGNVMVDPHLLIAYPNAFVFVINPDNQRLKLALERGLARAMADGSQRRLLQQRFFTPWLKQTLRLRDRRLLVLSTPETEALLRQTPRSAWLVPWDRLPRSDATPLPAAVLCQESFFAPLC